MERRNLLKERAQQAQAAMEALSWDAMDCNDTSEEMKMK